MKSTLKLSVVLLLFGLIVFSFFNRGSKIKTFFKAETRQSATPPKKMKVHQASKKGVGKTPLVASVSSGTQSRKMANAPLIVVSKPLASQPTLEQISDTTALPAKAAAEVKFDIPKMAELAKRNEAFRLEILPGRYVTVYPANFRIENEFHHISGTVSSAEGADVTLTMDGGKVLVGIIQDPPRSYQIVYSGHGTSYVVEVDSSKILPFYEKESVSQPGFLKNPVNEKQDGASLNRQDQKNSFDRIRQFVENTLIEKSEFLGELLSGRAQAGYTGKDANKKIRMYMVYNTVVRNANGGDVGTKAMIANQVAILNDSLVNSGVKFTVEVSKYVYNNAAIFSNFDDKIYSLPTDANYYTTFSNGYKSEAHKTVENLAQQFLNGSANRKDLLDTKSDTVHLWVAYQKSDASGRVRGIGDMWVANTANGSSDSSLSWNKPLLGLWGFSFSAMQANAVYVFAHESGHLFGLEHNIENSGYYNSSTKAVSNLRYPKQYNFGFHDNAKKVKTIMSYDSTCGKTLIDAKNQLTVKSTCPTLKSFSGGSPILGGLTANNKKKLLEFEAALFSVNPIGITEVMAKGYKDSGSYAPLKEALKSIKEIPVIVKADAKSIHLITENKVAPPSRAYFVSPSLFSSYVRTYKNGTLINEASHAESALSFETSPGFKKGDKIEFRFENRFGYASAKYVIADVHAPMSITVTKDIGDVVKSGSKALFKATVKANPAPTCKWFINNTDTGVNLASLNVDLTTKLASEKKTVEYRCNRNSLYGANETKVGSSVLTVMKVPTITTSPASIALKPNSTEITLKVAADGAGLTYQWFKNGAPLTNSNTTSLILKGNVSTLAGTYFVKVSNAVGAIESSPVSVALFVAPTITLGVNEKVDAVEGENLKLAATVTGSPTPNIAWSFNKTTISNAATFVMSGIKRSQAGVYSISASNTNPENLTASTVTKNITVNILYKPEILSKAIDSVTLLKGEPLKLSVEAQGNPAPVYRWFFQNKNGQISETSYNSSSILIPAVDINSEGFYYCEVSNSIGVVQSNKTALMIKPANKTEGFDQETGLSGLDLSDIKVKSNGGFWEAR